MRQNSTVSNKKFGFFCSGFLLFLGLYQVVSNHTFYLWPFFIAVAILTFALARYKPSIFSTLNRAWFNVGRILASVMNPLILGSIYFFIITPIATVTKLFGRDELRMKKMGTPSYWITKNKADKNLDSMKNQF